MALNDRSFGISRFDFSLDGSPVGYLESFKGARVASELAVHNQGPLRYPKKNVTVTKFEPMVISIGAGMGKAVYEWIEQSFKLNLQYKTGAVHQRDFEYKLQRQVDLTGMLITQVKFPPLKGDAKEPLYLEVGITPEGATWIKGDGSVNEGPVGPKQKAWHRANWRFEMGGLPCERVYSVEGLEWKCEVEWDCIGTKRIHTLHATTATISNITLTISTADQEDWAQAANDWFVRGNCLEQHEKNGALVLLAPDLTTEVGRVELLNCGFVNFDANQELKGQSAKGISRFKVEMYCEQGTCAMNYTDA